MAGLKTNHYFTITGLMCNEMGLSGNELLIYAIIRTFTQDGTSSFRGGRNYLASTLNITKQTVDKALNSLISKKYIIKINVSNSPSNPFYEYQANLELESDIKEGQPKKLPGGSQISLPGQPKKIPGGVKNLPGGSQKNYPNNNNNNIDGIISHNIGDIYEEKEIYKEREEVKPKKFTPPTVDEVREYCLENGYDIDPQYFIDFYESKGWMVGKNKMVNWRAAVRTWVKNNKQKPTKSLKPVEQSKTYNPVTEWKRQNGFKENPWL